MYVPDDELISQCQHFSKILLGFDIWGKYNVWPVLDIMHKALINLMNNKPLGVMNLNPSNIENDNNFWESNFSNGKEYPLDQILSFQEVRILWNQMSNLGKVYEDLCREWNLPTMLGVMTN